MMSGGRGGWRRATPGGQVHAQGCGWGTMLLRPFPPLLSPFSPPACMRRACLPDMPRVRQAQCPPQRLRKPRPPCNCKWGRALGTRAEAPMQVHPLDRIAHHLPRWRPQVEEVAAFMRYAGSPPPHKGCPSPTPMKTVPHHPSPLLTAAAGGEGAGRVGGVPDCLPRGQQVSVVCECCDNK